MDTLNQSCFCTGLDEGGLAAAIAAPDLEALIRERCPHAFAARPVFVAACELDRMAAVVAATTRVMGLPAFREAALAGAPAIARHSPRGAQGVFFGHDFHLAGGHLGLIEINTNAGGAMLNLVAARSQRSCCPAVQRALPTIDRADAFERAIVAMFRNEWALTGATTPLRTVAIVDDAPQDQYLYPEFLLFQRLFERNGIAAVVCDPRDLQWADGRLWAVGQGERRAIDLVYNRLTDFYLEQPEHLALRQAYLADAIVLTPHPQAHALQADKRHLITLSDDTQLQAMGASEADRVLLADTVPRTLDLNRESADRFWHERRQWFFKPARGFGSKAAYRGDKLTRRVWEEMLASTDIVAQALVAPGERAIDAADGMHTLKFDLRNYTYQGQVQWVGARLYQGQTMNLRTARGGFAPVHRVENHLV